MDANPPGLSLIPIGTQGGQPVCYRLAQPRAFRLRDLLMHKADLELVCVWLSDLLPHYPKGSPPPTRSAHDEALWTAGVIAFFRCFTSSARGQLDAKRVFAAEPEGAMEAYKRLEQLRNRTMAHDESLFHQGFVGVPVHNPEGPVARVGPVRVIVMKVSTMDFEEISNLLNLSQAAIRWIDSEAPKLEATLNEEVRAMSRAELVSNGPIQWTAPDLNEAGSARPRW